MKRFFRIIVRVLSISLVSIFLLFIFIAFLISLPPVQSQVARWAVGFLEDKLNTRIELSEVDLGLPSDAILRNLVIYDREMLPMIEVEEARIDLLTFSIWRFLQDEEDARKLTVRRIELLRPQVQLVRSLPDSTLNLDIILPPKKDPREKKPFPLDLNLEQIEIIDGKFSFQDGTHPEGDSAFVRRLNFRNLCIDQLNGDLWLRLTPTGRFELGSRSLRAFETVSSLNIEELKTVFVSDTLHRFQREEDCYLEVPIVEFGDISLKSGRTELHGNLLFIGADVKAVFDKYPEENFELWLEGSSLDFSTLNYFLPKPIPLEGVVMAQGGIVGSYDAIRTRNFRARYMQDTRVMGDIFLENMRDPDELLLDIRLSESQVNFAELQQLLPEVPFPPLLKRIGAVGVDGTYEGHYYDFEVDVDIGTEVGDVLASLEMKLPPHVRSLTYAGHLTTNDLNVDLLGLFDRPISRDLNFSGRINGKGVTLADFNTSFDATIAHSDLLGYEIDSLYGKINVKDRLMMGRLEVFDDQGNANLFVNLDLASSPGTYQLEGVVDELNLQHYKLYDEPLLFSSSLNVDLAGDSLDNFSGTLGLEQTYMHRVASSKEVFHIPDFRLQTGDNAAGQRFLSLESTLMDASLTGDFTLTKASDLVKRLVHEGRLYFDNDSTQTRAYYSEKREKIQSFDTLTVQFAINSKDSVNEVFRYLNTPIFIAPGSFLKGKVRFDEIENAIITMQVDSFQYKGFSFRDGQISLDLIKDALSDYTLWEAGFRGFSVSPASGFVLDSVHADVELSEDRLEAVLFADQKKEGNRALITSTSIFQEDGTIVTLLDSSNTWLVLKDLFWTVNESNQLVFSEAGIEVEKFIFKSKRQEIKSWGMISQSPESQLFFEVDNLNIGILNDLTSFKYQLGGRLDIGVAISEVLGVPKISANGRIARFSLDDYRYGDLLVESKWDRIGKKLDLEAKLVHQDDSRINLLGSYHFAETESPLDFRLITEGMFPLAYVSPFVRTQLYDIEGKVELDEFSITGTLANLIVLGTGRFVGAKFGVEMFKTSYSFSGEIQFNRNYVDFPRIKLYDERGKTAEFYGQIYHRGFRNLVFDLQLEKIENFLLMNTKKADNPLYYGTLFVDGGVASISGDLEVLEISAFAISGDGTKLKIPLSDEVALERPDFIRFEGDLEDESRNLKTGLQGFDLNLTVQATPEAEVEMIFDEKVGDIIRGRGEGTLNLRINDQGEFSMTGEYEITEGDYLFTAQDVVNKKFSVKPGGSISWSGDPYEASLDLEAVYQVNADIKYLLGLDQTVRVPVNVLMHLEGSLLQPEITLDIEISNLREQDAIYIANYIRTITYDEQELNKQVFSLMLFSRFAASGTLVADNLANSGVTSSISELLSNQLNYWLSQALGENFSVGVGTTNFQDLDLLISASLFNDRVKIERDGTLVSSNSNFSLGNISVIIKLLPTPGDEANGRRRRSELVLEVFNRQNLDVSFRQTYQAGLGVFYKKDFDTLKDLLKGKK